MYPQSLHTPVALFIYNRPDTTERVFAEIRRAKPQKLLVIADGPKTNRHGDSERCSAARALLEKVDWECDVKKAYSDVNLGCGRRISSGLDWVFQTVDHAIILEDDCLPHPTFFSFCQELLARYAGEDRIATISGNNFNRSEPSHSSYSFSIYPLTWGWASWARAWEYNDFQMRQWLSLRTGGWLRELFESRWSAAYWRSIFEKVYQDHTDVWDYQWAFSCWTNHLLAIHPCVNLVSNIGFGQTATHTKDPYCKRADYPIRPMSFPLSHPPVIACDRKMDREIERTVHNIFPFGGTSLARIGRGLRRMANRLARKGES